MVGKPGLAWAAPHKDLYARRLEPVLASVSLAYLSKLLRIQN